MSTPGQPSDGLPQALVDQMQVIFGKHPGYRTTHAKGVLLQGTFEASKDASTLTIAPHFNQAKTPILARFSVGGGIPSVADADNKATPKGIAIRFLLGGDAHFDLISHSFNGFAVRTAEDFLELLKLLVAAGSKKPEDMQKLGAFLKTHPGANVFVTGDRPNPVSYGTMTYYQPNTHVLTNSAGQTTNVRYRLLSVEGDQLLTADQAAAAAKNYLEDDLKARLPGRPIVFSLVAHIADPHDILDDATIPYKSTTFLTMGKIKVESIMDDNAARQQQIAFSPVPLGVEGIAPSADPLIQARDGVYYISTAQRRSQVQTE